MKNTTIRALDGWLRRARYTLPVASGAALIALFASACGVSDILAVQDPDVATQQSTNNAAALPAVLAGAIGDFHAAYGGTGNNNESSGQIGYSGLLSDEIRSSDTFPTREEIDARSIQLTNASNETMFINLSRSRASADRAALRFETFAPTDEGLAHVLDLGGLTRIMFAENYCSGVPFSTAEDNGTLDFGDPETTDQILSDALAKFDSAAQISGASSADLNIAAIGAGRALLDQGQFAQAAAAVANVPDDFMFLDESSANTTQQQNGIFEFFQLVKRLSIPNEEGENGLPYIDAGHVDTVVTRVKVIGGKDTTVQVDTLRASRDVRIPVLDKNIKGFDKQTEAVWQLRDTTRDAPLPVASGIEARLIEAEAALQAGDATTFLTKLNAARAQFPGLAALPADSVPADLNGRTLLLFRERAYDLWLTSHRLGDLRRMVRQYGFGTEQVFPTGPRAKTGKAYGPDVNLPVPQVETNNPKFTGCLNRDA